MATEIRRNIGRQLSKPVGFLACVPSFVQFSMSDPYLEEIMAAFRCFDPILDAIALRQGVHPRFLHEGERCKLKGGKKERTKVRQDEQGKGEGEVFG